MILDSLLRTWGSSKVGRVDLLCVSEAKEAVLGENILGLW